MANDQAPENVIEEPIDGVLLAIPEDQIDRVLAALAPIDTGGEVSGFASGATTVSDMKCTDSDR